MNHHECNMFAYIPGCVLSSVTDTEPTQRTTWTRKKKKTPNILEASLWKHNQTQIQGRRKVIWFCFIFLCSCHLQCIRSRYGVYRLQSVT